MPFLPFDMTVTFGALKPAHLSLYPAMLKCGRLVLGEHRDHGFRALWHEIFNAEAARRSIPAGTNMIAASFTRLPARCRERLRSQPLPQQGPERDMFE